MKEGWKEDRAGGREGEKVKKGREGREGGGVEREEGGGREKLSLSNSEHKLNLNSHSHRTLKDATRQLIIASRFLLPFLLSSLTLPASLLSPLPTFLTGSVSPSLNYLFFFLIFTLTPSSLYLFNPSPLSRFPTLSVPIFTFLSLI